MDWVWVAVVLAGSGAVSVAAGSLYRNWLVDRRRGRAFVGLVATAALGSMVWLGSRNGWLLAAVVVFSAFVLITRIVGPWYYMRFAAPVAALSLDAFTDMFVDRLVRKPVYVARLECYDKSMVLDVAHSAADSLTGRSGVLFWYDGECVVCAIQRGFAAAEAAAADGALAGMAEEFCRQYAEQPRFVLVFKMRPPDVIWQWGHRMLPVPIVPEDLCSEHSIPSSTG